MGKLSYFMKQKDRTYNNYSTQYEQNSWNFTENQKGKGYSEYWKQRI